MEKKVYPLGPLDIAFTFCEEVERFGCPGGRVPEPLPLGVLPDRGQDGLVVTGHLLKLIGIRSLGKGARRFR